MMNESTPILLILDIDETLLHASHIPLGRPADFEVFGYYIYLRPHLTEFLLGCSQHFRLAVWSSASDDYVAEIIRRIVPNTVPLEFAWGRSRCTYCFNNIAFEQVGYADFQSHYNYVKVLKKLKRRGYSLDRVVIVDDTPSKSQRNYGNAIYPTEYIGKPDDRELLQLLQYLVRIKDVPNVRIVEKRHWRDVVANM
ncbi:HAD family hydrolase [Hymenobacter aerilatus]|uniref:HAD family hydrolase n=1 Tax=Hymenobacter aerilatus TaxID=2932251 RepID=A0A8T9T110_9BACT|nr:HAD family hydrolase [Hymenobacter aerilatus]UOR07527.1 HAD family hydrolase [Hymenobacter aerilatus]